MYAAGHTNNYSVVRKQLQECNVTFIVVYCMRSHATNYQQLIWSLCGTSVIEITHRFTRLCDLKYHITKHRILSSTLYKTTITNIVLFLKS